MDINFELDEFFPFQVSIFYRAVSDAVSKAYLVDFDLTVSQWRTLAVLGQHDALSASEIVRNSSMNKVTVSRAIKGLRVRGLLKRDIDGDDKRKAVLRLTRDGRKTFQAIVPHVNRLAADCLAGLTLDEQNLLISLMNRVQNNAEKIVASNHDQN